MRKSQASGQLKVPAVPKKKAIMKKNPITNLTIIFILRFFWDMVGFFFKDLFFLEFAFFC